MLAPLIISDLACKAYRQTNGDRWTDRIKPRQIRADTQQGGSQNSSLVTSQRARMKEMFLVKQGITQMMPGITDVL